MAPSSLQAKILQTAEALTERMKGEKPSLFSKSRWLRLILDLAMEDHEFKVDMFHFVDALPMLTTNEQVSQHVRDYRLHEKRALPLWASAVFKMASNPLTAAPAVATIRTIVTEIAKTFIVGRDTAEALATLRRLHEEGFAFTTDLLGESTVSAAEARQYQARYLDLIRCLAQEVPRWQADAVIDNNHLGPIPRANISLKLSALEAHLDSVDTEGSVARLKERVLPIFLLAQQNNVFVNLDVETWELHGITYDLFEEIVTHPDLRSYPHVGIVVQAYLKTAHEDMQRLLDLVRKRGTPITVRLVKGAYWDYEVVHARQHGYPCPVFTRKADTDANYERLTVMLLQHFEELSPAFASHNLRSLVHALVQAEERNVPPLAYEVQMLYGMAEPERKAVRSMGRRVRVYAPIGELLLGMAYLVRRLLENTANTSFLRSRYHEGTDIASLMATPQSSISFNG
ncbi:MAG: proline dehydrogenase family protein [Abditibacteriales bacterium]|nr:proline dehydrogenase family protein [Abditibacteriales bacterium]MDW8365740.1 proline dehydrogenase family protein [Abditibacteriales bacterium]